MEGGRRGGEGREVGERRRGGRWVREKRVREVGERKGSEGGG